MALLVLRSVGLCVGQKTKCATCAVAEKQKNVRWAKIKSLDFVIVCSFFLSVWSWRYRPLPLLPTKGRNRYYAYYHCVGGCSHRVNAEKVNNAIKDDLLKFMPKIEDKLFYQEAICKEYLEQTDQLHLEQNEILIQIKDYEDRLSHMRELLATRQIDAEDYREIKSQYNSKISAFESQLTTLNNDVSNVQVLIDQGLSKIMEINNSLEAGSLLEIRKDIGSIYPEKMHFDKTGVRTARRNDFIQYINLINKKLRAKKTGQK